MKARLVFWLLIFSSIVEVNAQNFNLDSYDNGTPSIANYAETQSGKTIQNYITLEIKSIPFGTAMPAGWTLRVRANGPFLNGSSSISSDYVSLRFRSVSAGPGGVSGSAVPLTSVDANLIATANPLNAPSDYYVAQKFDMIIQGGAHLLTTPGNYSTTLTVSLYNNLGILVSSKGNIPIAFAVNFSNTCNNAVIAGSNGPSYNFDTYAKLAAGATITDAISVQYTPNNANCIGWSLKVRANGNFVNGLSSVSPQYVSLRFNRVSDGAPSAGSIGVNGTAVPLSMIDTDLITQSNAPFQGYTQHKFDLIIQGGVHLQLASASGTYTCPLTFSLYNQSGQLISSFNVNAYFQISYANSFSYTVVLQDADVSVDYSNPSAFASGVSVTKTNGLRVTGYNPYQVIVKTSTANLTSGANTIPVSVVNLQSTPPGGRPGISVFTRSLSSSDQVIITNGMNNHNYQIVDYTLRYYTNGGNSQITTAPAGTYSTQLLYIVLPL